MLNYTSLFDDLQELYKSAGQDPRSFRRLAREVARVAEDLDETYTEVAGDYVVRLLARLEGDDEAMLSEQEVTLVRAFLGLPPRDPERDARLVDDLSALETTLGQVLELKDRPLSMKNLDALRRLLGRMKAAVPPIVHSLEERERARRFDEAAGPDGGKRGRDWMVVTLRRAVEGADPSSITSSEELRLGG
jgi:hypothetical protein